MQTVRGMKDQSTNIHEAAAKGFTRAAGAYVEGRPGYPAEIDSWLRETLGLCAGRAALDLGAGTGKFTSRLLDTGARVTAVEPVDAMLGRLVGALPEVDARSGTAEEIPLGDETMDAVVCAQSFHWFASAGVLAEIRRVLKPGGKLGLIWNLRDERVSWVAALTEIMRPYEGGTPRFHEGQWRQLFPAEGFGPLGEFSFCHSHSGPAEKVIVQRVMSVSFIAALPIEKQERVAQEIRDLILNTATLAGRNEVTFPYTTLAAHCSKV